MNVPANAISSHVHHTFVSFWLKRRRLSHMNLMVLVREESWIRTRWYESLPGDSSMLDFMDSRHCCGVQSEYGAQKHDRRAVEYLSNFVMLPQQAASMAN